MQDITLHFALVCPNLAALIVKVGSATYRGDLADKGAHIALGGSLVNLPAALRSVLPDVMQAANSMRPTDPPRTISHRLAL